MGAHHRARLIAGEETRVVSERLAPEALPREVEGDPALADDLATASSAFATL